MVSYPQACGQLFTMLSFSCFHIRIISQGFLFVSAAYSWKHYIVYYCLCSVYLNLFSQAAFSPSCKNFACEFFSFLLIVFERRSIDTWPSLHVQNIGQNQLQVLEIYRFWKYSKNVIINTYILGTFLLRCFVSSGR